jgi:hypothetical protein
MATTTEVIKPLAKAITGMQKLFESGFIGSKQQLANTKPGHAIYMSQSYQT